MINYTYDDFPNARLKLLFRLYQKQRDYAEHKVPAFAWLPIYAMQGPIAGSSADRRLRELRSPQFNNVPILGPKRFTNEDGSKTVPHYALGAWFSKAEIDKVVEQGRDYYCELELDENLYGKT